MRRLFWVAVGAGATVVVARKAGRLRQAVTPAGLAGRVDATVVTLRGFADEVRAGMAERELELRTALRMDGDTDGDTDGSMDDRAGKQRGGHS